MVREDLDGDGWADIVSFGRNREAWWLSVFRWKDNPFLGSFGIAQLRKPYWSIVIEVSPDCRMQMWISDMTHDNIPDVNFDGDCPDHSFRYTLMGRGDGWFSAIKRY